MNDGVTTDEKFIYWMIGLSVLLIVAWTILKRWVDDPLAGAIVAFVFIPLARFLPGAKKFSAAKTLLLAAGGALLVFTGLSLLMLL